MDVSKKTLHKLNSRRQFIAKINNSLKSAENKYLHYQNRKEHLYDEKKPNTAQKVYRQLTKPYEIQYHITRSVDENGKTKYSNGFKIAESSGNNQHQRGIIHKLDSFRKHNIHSDVNAPKAVSLGTEAAFRTGMATETGFLRIKDNIQYRTKTALDSKVRQDAQGDADKAGILLIANTAAASKGFIQHINDKRHYKPLENNLRKQLRITSKLVTADKRLVKKQNRLYIKSAILADRFQKKTGRSKAPSDKVQYVLNKKQKLRLLSKQDKSYISDLAIEKINGKLTKLRNRKSQTQLKLYKIKNRPLVYKATAGLTANFKSTLRNQAMKDGAADNDAVMAVDKISTLGRRQLKKRKNKDVKLNKRLNKYSKREKAFHKKSAKVKKKAPKKSKANLNAQRVYKEYAAKKAKKAIRRRKASKFGLMVISVLTPIILMPILLTGCLGVFANPGNFNFVTAYYGASECDLTKASDYYQELSYNLNKFVLSVPDKWKDNLSKLNIPEDYTDEPKRFVFGNSDRLHCDTTYDYDKHKLYSYLCAFLLTKDDEGAVKNWDFNDNSKAAIEALFNSEYEFESYFDNTSHWEYRNEFEHFEYYLYSGCYWNGEYGIVEVTYPDALPEAIQNALNENNLYFNVDNGEILNYNNGCAATGWYLKDQYCNSVDNNGNEYHGYYEGEECNFGVNDGDRFIPFNYVISDENWISILHKYDRINECTLYYTVNRKKSLDDCIKDSLLSLESGESLYNYYLTLSPDTEPQYYGMHQVGTSPVYDGYIELMNNNLILHGYGYEMKEWNESDCVFNTNDEQHSGISIIQNSGSNVYAMVSGEITEVGDNYFILSGFEKDRKIYIQPVIVYVNVDTSTLSVGQKIEKRQIITHTNNSRQEMQHLDCISKPFDISLIDNNTGYDYVNITIFDKNDYRKTVIDPEIIISLSDE